MAVIIEAAGGKASTGLYRKEIKDILDLVPTTVHERVPVIIGSASEVNYVLSHYN